MAITPSPAQRAAFTPISIKYQAFRKGATQVTTSKPAVAAMLMARGYRMFLAWTVIETSPNHRVISNLTRLENK